MAEIKITLQRSVIGHPQDQKDTVRKLGIKRLHQTVVHEDSPSLRGMLAKVQHLVDVQEASQE